MADLPDSYDLIVIGTGMPECIIAAAAARIGKSVLHLDRNHYYGELWASFNFEYLTQWVERQKDLPHELVNRMLEVSWLEQLNNDENLVLCPKETAVALDIVQKSFLEKETIRENNISESNLQQNIPDNQPMNSSAGESEENIGIANSELFLPESDISVANAGGISQDDVHSQGSVAQLGNDSLPQACASDGQSSATPDFSCGSALQDSDSATAQNISPPDGPHHAEENAEQAENLTSGDEALPTNETDNSREVPEPVEAVQPSVHRWTTDDFFRNRHKFNIDLSPKLLFSRGALVELLISSNTSRYADFQSVNRILTLINGHLEQVPCSRADVFSTKNVTVVEKRMLMKLLTFCLEYQKHPEEYRGYEGRPFIEFLRSRKITPNIEHYILHAIAMVDEFCLTLQGLQATQKFMESLGRFGNSPFLWTCYGSAELPQCFCRLCAVFGGIYYLGRDADAIILDSDNRCVGVISHGKKLKCSSLVMEYSYLPVQYRIGDAAEMVSRAIYITDESILPAERHQNTFLRLPPVAGIRNAISVLEFSSLSFICPKDLYVVHMTCKPFGDSVAEDFASAEKELFMSPEEESTSEEACHKPKILWSLQFRHLDVTMLDINSKVPASLFATSPPGLELDFEHAVKEASRIFERIFPGEEFLPRAPDPEDIVMETHSNPGNDETNDVIPCEKPGDGEEVTTKESDSGQDDEQKAQQPDIEGCCETNPDSTEKEISINR